MAQWVKVLDLQATWPEFNPYKPHGGGGESALRSLQPHMCAVASHTYSGFFLMFSCKCFLRRHLKNKQLCRKLFFKIHFYARQ